MADHITGITGVTAVTLTRKAMNNRATAVLLKSKTGRLGSTSLTPSQESDMDKKLVKAMLGLPEDQRVYAAGLEDDAVEPFLLKTGEERAAEVKVKSDKDKAEAEERARKEKSEKDGDPRVVSLEKSVQSLTAEVMEGRVEKKKSKIRKAAEAFPNVPSAFDQLMAIDDMTDEQKAPLLKSLASQEAMAKQLTKSFGAARPAVEEGSAQAELDGVVAEVAKTKKLEKSAAFMEVSQDPAHAELIARVREEEGIA